MSDRRLRSLGLGIAILGLGVSVYLTWVHLSGGESICVAGGGGCERVQSSEFAELAGVPVAIIGVAGYLSIAVALAAPGELARIAAAFLGLVGFGFSAYLTYLELFEIEAICQWCVFSAVLMTALSVIAALRAASVDDATSSAGS